LDQGGGASAAAPGPARAGLCRFATARRDGPGNVGKAAAGEIGLAVTRVMLAVSAGTIARIVPS
jgi:hypothetical protein